MDAKRDLKLSEALFTSNSPLRANLSGRVTPLLPETELSGRPVSFNKSVSTKRGSIFPVTFMARACFSNVFQFSIGETVLPAPPVFVFKIEIMLMLHGREF